MPATRVIVLLPLFGAASALRVGNASGFGVANATQQAVPDAVNLHAAKTRQVPCNCEVANPAWKTPAPRPPACLFIDLGAADGETYRSFLGTSSKWNFSYDVGSFRREDCFAYLIEANPAFDQPLEVLRANRVYPMEHTAIYMCDKEHETFYLDAQGPGGWGSSLDQNHEAVTDKTGSKLAIDVKLYSLMRLLHENALPNDMVVVKMDIEGAEYDILPCLANSPAASLVDRLYLEDHCPGDWWCPTTGQAGNTKEVFNSALATLRSQGVVIPDGYWSPMM